jgi:hypothetical protein
MIKKIREVLREWLELICFVMALFLMMVMLQYYAPQINPNVHLMIDTAVMKCHQQQIYLEREIRKRDYELSKSRFVITRAYMEGRISEKEYNEQY